MNNQIKILMLIIIETKIKNFAERKATLVSYLNLKST